MDAQPNPSGTLFCGVEIDVDELPPKLRLMIKDIGFAAAVKLAQALGGTSLYVPGEVGPNHALEVIGPEAFALLVEHYGNTNITLTKADSLFRQVRHRRVIDLAASGKRVREIAMDTGYSARSVELILKRHRQKEAKP